MCALCLSRPTHLWVMERKMETYRWTYRPANTVYCFSTGENLVMQCTSVTTKTNWFDYLWCTFWKHVSMDIRYHFTDFEMTIFKPSQKPLWNLFTGIFICKSKHSFFKDRKVRRIIQFHGSMYPPTHSFRWSCLH